MKRLTFGLVLALSKDGVKYDLYSDASYSGLGVMLIQQDKVIIYD